MSSSLQQCLSPCGPVAEQNEATSCCCGVRTSLPGRRSFAPAAAMTNADKHVPSHAKPPACQALLFVWSSSTTKLEPLDLPLQPQSFIFPFFLLKSQPRVRLLVLVPVLQCDKSSNPTFPRKFLNACHGDTYDSTATIQGFFDPSSTRKVHRCQFVYALSLLFYGHMDRRMG